MGIISGLITVVGQTLFLIVFRSNCAKNTATLSAAMIIIMTTSKSCHKEKGEKFYLFPTLINNLMFFFK